MGCGRVVRRTVGDVQQQEDIVTQSEQGESKKYVYWFAEDDVDRVREVMGESDVQLKPVTRTPRRRGDGV